jgi:hypothetical protein
MRLLEASVPTRVIAEPAVDLNLRVTESCLANHPSNSARFGVQGVRETIRVVRPNEVSVISLATRVAQYLGMFKSSG